MNGKLQHLEAFYRWIKEQRAEGRRECILYNTANAEWGRLYPNDPTPMFGPEANMRKGNIPTVAARCECGSGTNERGPQHSHWCGLHGVYND